MNRIGDKSRLSATEISKLLCTVSKNSEDYWKGKEEYLYSAFIQRLVQSAQTWITQFYLQRTPCLPFLRKRSPDGASTGCDGGPILIYRLRRNERLSWPGWLTYSGRFTHISGHPSATGRAQDGERTLARDWPSTAEPRGPTKPALFFDRRARTHCSRCCKDQRCWRSCVEPRLQACVITEWEQYGHTLWLLVNTDHHAAVLVFNITSGHLAIENNCSVDVALTFRYIFKQYFQEVLIFSQKCSVRNNYCNFDWHLCKFETEIAKRSRDVLWTTVYSVHVYVWFYNPFWYKFSHILSLVALKCLSVLVCPKGTTQYSITYRTWGRSPSLNERNEWRLLLSWSHLNASHESTAAVL